MDRFEVVVGVEIVEVGEIGEAARVKEVDNSSFPDPSM